MTKPDALGCLAFLMLGVLFAFTVAKSTDKFYPDEPIVADSVPVGTEPGIDGWKRYHAVVDRVVDGDTVDVVLDLGFDLSLRGRFRLAGIDTPEMNTPAGKAARARTVELLPVGGHVFVETFKADAKDKYGRYLGRFVQADGTDICEILVREGHAKVYWPK